MAGAALYGFCIGVGFVMLVRGAPQPAGSILFWGFFAGQLAWGTTITWRRTGLPFATASMGLAAAQSGAFVVLAAAGWIFPDFPPAWWIPIGLALAGPPILLLIESRVNRAKWIRWRHFMEEATVLDVVTARHIPWLRDQGTDGDAGPAAHPRGSNPGGVRS